MSGKLRLCNSSKLLTNISANIFRCCLVFFPLLLTSLNYIYTMDVTHRWYCPTRASHPAADQTFPISPPRLATTPKPTQMRASSRAATERPDRAGPPNMTQRALPAHARYVEFNTSHVRGGHFILLFARFYLKVSIFLKSYLKNYWTNTRHVCTHFNAFVMVYIQIWYVVRMTNFDIFWDNCMTFWDFLWDFGNSVCIRKVTMWKVSKIEQVTLKT